MNKQEATAIAKELFASHDVKEFFIAKDGQAFFNKQSAENHQQSFKTTDEVFHITRDKAEAFTNVAEDISADETVIDEATGKEEKKKPAAKKK